MNRARLTMVIIAVILLAPVLFPSLARADGPEYTTEEILQLIEANGGSKGLDLSGKDLSGIDLSRERIQAELEKVREEDPEAKPVWVSWITDGINLAEANLQEANLRGANLQEADLVEANLQGARLGKANLQGASLGGANLQGADLWEANLKGAFLPEANLQGADLLEANLREAFLEGTDLTEVDLLHAQSLDGIALFGANLSRTNLSMWQLGGAIGEERNGDYWKAKEAYRALKVNFREIGRYDDAMWAYRKERQMEKRILWPGLEAWRYYSNEPLLSRLIIYIDLLGNWLLLEAFDQLTGYGQSISQVVVWSWRIILLFAGMYWFFGGLGTDDEEMPPHSRHPRDWLRSLNYSIAAFATMVYSSLEPRTSRTQTLSSVEAILGILMLALLMFVIGNRIGGI